MADPTQSAAAELTREDSSRRSFMKLVGSGGAAAFATLIAACGSSDSSSTTASSAATSTGTMTRTTAAGNAGDLEIVNYALTLEYIEAAFYEKVVASGLFKGRQQDLLKQIADAENQHVAALTATAKQLGGTPVARPQTRFPLGSAGAVVQLAAVVENLGAAAYLGQAPRISSKEVLAAALSIHSVEGRHAAALNTLAGRTITPDGAFAKPASMAQVLPKVKPFIVS
ncbi:ferritin-like domain-containing protein [Conexibacter sp. JD483]|uniref:ferritin-like domain-containing protein n=1 Tax=unclassified Conexibacter TaxID=2627773 RepID=UPI00272331A3|nr:MULTISPECIES: ferritin-like domain-containing protein [unclassified Conexibacter]MDO8188142.1 ferritin-like domain-containing protein [Conexibacter sp. CPCC 205706]MDO8201294.1 ferritin-like domain-containing protein [Conexibacter sp. CPCC 205762]MDR9370434.1 ferritin-like domain-containing protein [Conexibacter sp. JD483]